MALLHDVVEDTPTTLDQLEKVFGSKVVTIFADLTDPPYASRAVRKQGQIDRAAKMSHGARLIKIADQYCNVADLPRKRPIDWTKAQTIDYVD